MRGVSLLLGSNFEHLSLNIRNGFDTFSLSGDNRDFSVMDTFSLIDWKELKNPDTELWAKKSRSVCKIYKAGMPALHPTKGYRRTHKNFRGGTR